MKKLLLAMASLLAAMFLLVPASGAQDSARIHLIHGIPGVDVDVEIDGSIAIPGFAFQDTQDLSSSAGETLVALKVKVAGTDTVAIDAGDVALPASGNYTVIAHLDADGNPTLGVFENDTSAIAAGEGRLTVRHTAAAPAVDVLANGSVALPNLANGEGQAADLAVGTISAEVVPTGETEPVVIGPADLPITDGTSLIVYAVGSLGDETITVLTESIEGLGTAPSTVNTGTSPVSSGSSAMPVLLLTAAVAAVALTGGALRFASVRAGR
jgi:hypothetical protein